MLRLGCMLMCGIVHTLAAAIAPRYDSVGPGLAGGAAWVSPRAYALPAHHRGAGGLLSLSPHPLSPACRAMPPALGLSMTAASQGNTARAKEVLDALYAGKDGQEFWEWRDSGHGKRGSSTSEYTYGELDLELFVPMMALAQPKEGDVFCDFGSGCGRLVIYSAIAYPQLKESRGLEIQEVLHEAAVSALEAAQGGKGTTEEEREMLGGGRVQLKVGNAYEDTQLLHDVDLMFCYSTAFDSVGPLLTQLSACLGRNMKVGAKVITVDKMLVSEGPWEFEELQKVEGRNSELGSSVGYLYQVVKSPLQDKE